MTISRRRFLAASTSVAAAVFACGLPGECGAQTTFFPKRHKAVPLAPSFVYFGTDTAKPEAKGIYVSRFDPATGKLTPPVVAAASLRPAFFVLGLGHGKRVLHVCNEGDEHSSAISSFLIDPATGGLRPLGKVSSGSMGPCYLALDADGQTAYAASYSGSGIATYLVQPDGSLSQPVERIDFKGSGFGQHGPNAERQQAAHPHSARLSPDNRFLIVNDLGNDSIVTFPVDAATARLGAPHVNERREGSGPRHIAFHPNGRWIYSVNELDNRVDQLLWSSTRGDHAHGVEPQALLTDAGHSVSTLGAGFHGTNTAAEVEISASGSYLYVSNRGENSLVVFTIDQTNGMLTVLQRISCGGKTPRQFTFDPTGKWLLCGNQESDSVTVFACDQSSGRLSGPAQTLAVPAPMMTLFG